MTQFDYDSGFGKAAHIVAEHYGNMLVDAIVEIDRINRAVGNELDEGELPKRGLHAQGKLMNSEILEAWTSILVGPDNTRDDIADMLFVAAGFIARYSRNIDISEVVRAWQLQETIERLLNNFPVHDERLFDVRGSKYEKLAAIATLTNMVSHYHDNYTAPRDGVAVGELTITSCVLLDLFRSILDYACVSAGDSTKCEFLIVQTIDDLFKVIESNKTKFCKTADEANATIRKYEKLGVTTHAEESSLGYVIKSSVTVTGSDGKQYPQGKWLKSINFVDAEFDVRGEEKY